MSRDAPPTDWPGLEMTEVTRLTDDIYYGWVGGHTNPVFWHWCAPAVPELTATGSRWIAVNSEAHTLVSREPLHLEPSLLWSCCGLHGFVRGGVWTSA
ncbi:hypothetical protein AB0M87_04360 [Streptomyces sp. NPDC051320]|uniref:hypothetical protein n=1 Tax=Streptomyces sp. NPDC051320 TaxID=3154644 RepID=UPI0034196FFD